MTGFVLFCNDSKSCDFQWWMLPFFNFLLITCLWLWTIKTPLNLLKNNGRSHCLWGSWRSRENNFWWCSGWKAWVGTEILHSMRNEGGQRKPEMEGGTVCVCKANLLTPGWFVYLQTQLIRRASWDAHLIFLGVSTLLVKWRMMHKALKWGNKFLCKTKPS